MTAAAAEAQRSAREATAERDARIRTLRQRRDQLDRLAADVRSLSRAAVPAP